MGRKLQSVSVIIVVINNVVALQWFGSLGPCGWARLNDLHRVAESYRPALKALAGHAETQAEEMGVEN